MQQYRCFVRTCWLLAIVLTLSACTSNAGRQQTMDFRHFVRDFFADADFQRAHIRFPLEIVSYHYPDGADGPQLISDFIQHNDWLFFPGPDVYQCQQDCYDLMIYDSFDKKQRHSDQRVLAFEGVNNGIHSSLYFLYHQGRWQLVKYQQLDN